MKNLLAHLAVGAGVLSSCLATQGASADMVVAGVVKQLAPRPLYFYGGSYAQYFSSSIVSNPVDRTLITIDLHGLMQAAGLNWLERIEIYDTANNVYGGSPGADIDYCVLEGGPSNATTSFAYAGSNNQHVNENSLTLATRVGAMDGMSGDQDYNSLHFVSLGLSGVLSMTFSIPPAPGGGGGGGNGGPDEYPGGGGAPTNLMEVLPGLKLRLSETGSSEMYGIRLYGYAVPGPGAAALIALLPRVLGSRRRRT